MYIMYSCPDAIKRVVVLYLLRVLVPLSVMNARLDSHLLDSVSTQIVDCSLVGIIVAYANCGLQKTFFIVMIVDFVALE